MKTFIFLALICFVQGRANDAFRMETQLQDLLEEVGGLKQDLNDYNNEMKTDKKNALKPMPSSPSTPTPPPFPSTAEPGKPAGQPTGKPTGQPSKKFTGQPTGNPNGQPTGKTTGQPTGKPTGNPTGQPSGKPTGQPTTGGIKQPNLMLIKSLKMNVAHLFSYTKAVMKMMQHGEEQGHHHQHQGNHHQQHNHHHQQQGIHRQGEEGSKMMGMPPSSFIDVVLDLVKKTYWEAKRLKIIGQHMENKMEKMVQKEKMGMEQIKKEMGGNGDKEMEFSFASEQNMAHIFNILDKMCQDTKWASEHKEKIQKMLGSFERLAIMYKKLKYFKKVLGGMEKGEEEEEEEHYEEKKECTEMQKMFGYTNC